MTQFAVANALFHRLKFRCMRSIWHVIIKSAVYKRPKYFSKIIPQFQMDLSWGRNTKFSPRQIIFLTGVHMCQWVSWLVDLTCALRWRQNGRYSVSNHQPHDCLFNRLFRRRSKKTSKLRVTGLCVGNSPGPVNSPHKGPVTRKMFPFDDVIMDNHFMITSENVGKVGMQWKYETTFSLDRRDGISFIHI